MSAQAIPDPKIIENLPPELLNSIPALAPPDGVVSDFDHPESRGHIFVIVATLLLALMVVFFVNRIYTKVLIVRHFSWDDLTCTIGFVGAVATYVGTYVNVTKGMWGKHQWDVTLAVAFAKINTKSDYVAVVLVPPTLGIIKLTFFLLYLELFRPIKWLRYCAYIGATLSSSFYIAVTVAQFVFTTPKSGETWVDHILSGESSKGTSLTVLISAVGLVIDVYIFVVPLAAVSQLQLSPMRKLGVGLIFATGALACVGSILSIYYRVRYVHTADGTWNILPVVIMSVVEMYIGIIVACLPSFSKMLRHQLPQLEMLGSRLSNSRPWLRSSRNFKDSRYSENAKASKDIPMHSYIAEPKSNYYQDLESGRIQRPKPSADMRMDFGNPSSLGTYIGPGGARAPDEDGILLTREIHQH